MGLGRATGWACAVAMSPVALPHLILLCLQVTARGCCTPYR